jgi:hypothetical protein
VYGAGWGNAMTAKHERVTHSDIMRTRMIIRSAGCFACVIALDNVQLRVVVFRFSES